MSEPTGSMRYFSPADRQMEALAPPHMTLGQILVEHVLFHRKPLLIPDIFFFISTPLTQHVLKDGESKSFLASCVSNGFVIPALRAGGTFEASLMEIRAKKIQGLQPSDVVDEVRNALQLAQDNGRHFKGLSWPDQQLGLMFEDQLRSHLVCALAPPQVGPSAAITQSEMDELWRLTAVWRTESIEKAKLRTEGTGIQRGQIMNAVAAEIGLRAEVVNDINDLLRFAAEIGRHKELEAFFLWVNFLYHKNQSLAFNSTLTFPSFESMDAVFGRDTYLEYFNEYSNASTYKIHQTIKIPSSEVIFSCDFEEIIKIRENEGKEYFSALVAWENSPDLEGERTQRVRKTLLSYTEYLCAHVNPRVGPRT